MPDARQLAHEFLDALKANEAQRYEAILCDDAGMIIGGWDGSEAYRPRARVIQRLMEEWSAWPDPTLESFTFIAEGDHAAIEFRIQATEHRRYVEHERSAFLTIKDGKIHTINIYCAGPLPSARRKGWIAPATLTHDELERLFESLHQSGDIREWLPPLMSGKWSLRGFMGGSGMHIPAAIPSRACGGPPKKLIDASKKRSSITDNATSVFNGLSGRSTHRPIWASGWNGTASSSRAINR